MKRWYICIKYFHFQLWEGTYSRNHPPTPNPPNHPTPTPPPPHGKQGSTKSKIITMAADELATHGERASHYCDVIMGSIASLITSLTSVYSTVHSGTDQRKHQSSASLAFVWGIHRRPVNSPHKWPVTRKMFPFDDVIMRPCYWYGFHKHIVVALSSFL